MENSEETPEETTGSEENSNGGGHEESIEPEIVPDAPLKDPLDILKEQLDEKEAALAEQRNEYLRMVAETENFKKRLKKEKEDFNQFANEKLLKELLPIKDNLERALQAENPKIETLKEGVEMILKQFDSFLEKEKVEVIDAVGKPFDPSPCTRSLCQIESHEHAENTVTEEYSKGYQLNVEGFLRPSKVVVSKTPETPKNSSEDASRTDHSRDSNENEETARTPAGILERMTETQWAINLSPAQETRCPNFPKSKP